MENEPLLTPPPKIWNFPYVSSLFFFESFPKKREKVQKLNKLKIAAKANKKLRDKRKRVLNPDLHRDLLEIATIGAACSERRREDLFRSVKTLDDLHNALSGLNYKISRTALYYRLLPKKESSEEGKKHVHTVPVR